MKWATAAWLLIAGMILAGCARPPTSEEYRAKKAHCLKCYCSQDALAAEAALLDWAQFVQRCQEAGVEGISYNEVFSRIYGRLYLVERHLGHSKAAEEYLEKYARYHAIADTLAGQTGREHGEMERLIENKFDRGLRVVWKNN